MRYGKTNYNSSYLRIFGTCAIWLLPFHGNRDGDNEIYVMNADGSEQTRLTSVPGNDFFPNWSPDGRRIAFTSDRDGVTEIYGMYANGSHQTRLTNNSAIDFAPNWGRVQRD